MEMRAETEKAVLEIMDCFTGADGGAAFIFFRRLVEEMDKRAETGKDPAATEIVLAVVRFARLIRIAQGL